MKKIRNGKENIVEDAFIDYFQNCFAIWTPGSKSGPTVEAQMNTDPQAVKNPGSLLISQSFIE